MYHLLKGLHEYLTRKDEFSVIIIGLDGAGKSTLLEKIKTLYNDTPGLPPDKIVPTVGQNTGKISLPSALLQFWDLGGQRGIRSIWPKYYGDCHAVVFVIDAVDHERLSEGWEVFGTFPPTLLPITFEGDQPKTDKLQLSTDYQTRSSPPHRSSASRSSCS